VKFHKKQRLAEGEQKLLSNNYAERQLQRAQDWFQKLPRIWFVMILGGLFFGLFMFFKWWNRGQVNLVVSGDNIINMVVLIVVVMVLDSLWDFNGEEGQGWGNM